MIDDASGHTEQNALGGESSSQRTFVAAIKHNTRSICIDGEQLIDRYKCESDSASINLRWKRVLSGSIHPENR
ncbi:hypothetical protein TNCV_2003871 [Trichonephila clavipes]|nr:hypothetical protein TNCV_2003871 [Trichonephila clavipes]